MQLRDGSISRKGRSEEQQKTFSFHLQLFSFPESETI
jgi:hypothetical protein